MSPVEVGTQVFRSPFAALAEEIVIPDVSYPQFLFQCIRKNVKVLQDRVAVVDAVRDQCVMFKEVEPLAKQFASALTKKGFGKGEVFFYVTYNAALLYALQLGVQLCGGATRGCFQKEESGELEKQMRETKSRFILCEPETAKLVKMVSGRLGWPVILLSIDGAVEGATAVEEMAYEDDGSAYDGNVIIDPDEDVLFIASTSGSTGHPKGVLHTHRNMVALLASAGAPIDLERENLTHCTQFTVIGNYNIGPMMSVYGALVMGNTYVSMSKFDKDNYFRAFDHYKPNHLGLFSYLANVISQCPELEMRDVTGVEKILMAGSVINASTVAMLKKKFPCSKLEVSYGMTETMIVSSTSMGVHYKVKTDPMKEAQCATKVLKMEGETFVSCGVLLPLLEAKVIDVDAGNSVGRGIKGRILVRSPCIMKGYINLSNKEGFISVVDEDGWLDTGDLGFFDNDDHLYVIERLNMIFKYLMHQVSPVDIEGVILQHPSVQSVGVVGVPNPETTSAARAYVVIKPGCRVTEEEIKAIVADNMPFYKHLHGGVVFMDKLPESREEKWISQLF